MNIQYYLLSNINYDITLPIPIVGTYYVRKIIIRCFMKTILLKMNEC